jgi:processive 1,2-diacylglycerol beta-glucosyltransferase
LIMGGGQGLGPIKTIVRSLEKVWPGLQEIIVTGTNKKLFVSLKRKAGKCRQKVVVLGYVNNINELMEISDIVVTKPGGITTSEALSKNLPIIIVKPIPGQEISNARYLTGKSAAIRVDEPGSINTVVEDLLRDSEILNRMRQAAGFISKPSASFDIAKSILNR